MNSTPTVPGSVLEEQRRWTEPIRVLSLIMGLGPGGAERLLLLAARIRDREHFAEEVAYLLPTQHTIAPELEQVGLPIHFLGSHPARDPRWLAGLRRLLEARRYDVVHVHSPYVAGCARLVVRSMSEHTRPRLVSTEHNEWSSHASLTRALNAATFPLGDAWLAVSQEVRNSIPRALRSRVEVLVQGIAVRDVAPLRAQREEVRAELGLSPDDVAVVTIANYRRQKGYGDLLEAARLVRDRDVRVRFFVIGHGPLEAEIKARHAQLGLGGHVELLGYRPDAARVAAACDLFVLASHFEGLPLAVMEALAVGLPVVATRVGGIPEAVRDGIEGLIVPPRRPDLLAGAIEKLASDAGWRAVLARAAKARASTYDIEWSVRRTEDVYREVCARPRS